MKVVRIKRLEMHYFKGILNQTVDFGSSTNTVTGPNGSGKSTIMDAFFWCLWGKNAAGRADFLIKTVDKNGQEIPHVDHQVVLTLEVNGETQVFDRTLTPKYDKEGELKGNTTTYTWNQVPLKMSEYNAKVSEVITEEIFKLIASPTAFLTMDWQVQRSTLMKMAGTVDDQDVAAELDKGQEGEYHELIKTLTGKTLEEYKRELDSKIKKTNEQMQSIPARIDEVTRCAPAQVDFEALKEQRQQLQDQMTAIEQQERDDRKAYDTRNADRNALLKAIDGHQLRRSQVISEAEAKERTAIHQSNQTYIKAEAEYKSIKAEIETDTSYATTQQNVLKTSIEKSRTAHANMTADIAKLREDWKKENSTKFEAAESLVCPLYGHACTDPQACANYDQNQQGAYMAFVEQKKKNLDAINARGAAMSGQIKSLLDTIDSQLLDLKRIGAELDGRCSQRKERLQVLEQLMQANPKRPLIANIDPNTLPEVVEIDAKLAELNKQLNAMSEVEPISTTNEEAKRSIREQLDALSREEAKKQQIETAEKRIEELQYQLTELGAQKAELEQQKRLTLDFEVARMNAVSEKVNSMFRLVKWQMFQRQVNGEEVPACICLVDGVRWQDANTAARMNAGIDVAAVLANAAKSFAPVFIDNAESNGGIYVPDRLPIQQIRLRFDREATTLTVTKK